MNSTTTSSTPPRISPIAGTTNTAGQAVDDGKGRIFPCEQCGADLEFHIGQQSLKCPFCGFVKQLEISEDRPVAEQDFCAMLARLAELRASGRSDAAETSEVRCESCGATVVFTGTLTSTDCVCCGSPIQREHVHTAENRVPVDGLLPFQIEQRRAAENLKRWVASRWFAPNDFRRRGVDGRFNGVYLPFWTFDSMTATRYTGQRGEHYWVEEGQGDQKRRVRHTRWWPVSGNFQRFFDDVLVCAATGLPKSVMISLEPWPLASTMPFNQQVLAGFFAQTYAVPLERGFSAAKERIDAAIQQDVRGRIGGDEQRIDSIHTRYDALTYKHLLLPVWLLAYKYNAKTYQVVVNACTGEVQGERPYSWVKITLFVASLAAAVAAIVLVANQ
jgi:hypothetical protein